MYFRGRSRKRGRGMSSFNMWHTVVRFAQTSRGRISLVRVYSEDWLDSVWTVVSWIRSNLSSSITRLFLIILKKIYVYFNFSVWCQILDRRQQWLKLILIPIDEFCVPFRYEMAPVSIQSLPLQPLAPPGPDRIPIQVRTVQYACNMVFVCIPVVCFVFVGYLIRTKSQRMDQHTRHLTLSTDERSNGNQVYMGVRRDWISSFVSNFIIHHRNL